MRLPDRKLLLVFVAVAAVVIAVLLVLLLRKEKQLQAEVGAPAPALVGNAVRGGEVNLERLRSHVVLLSFLNSRAQEAPEDDPSRAQTVVLRSMQTQHARFGLRVIIVDAAEIAGAGRPSRDELVNYTYDWNLEPAIAVLGDDGTRAGRFAVQSAPATFLIGPDGVVRERWDAFVPVAQLDLAIRRLEGRSPAD
jgi:hypothetical protein